MKLFLKYTSAKVVKIILFASIFLSFNLKHPFYLSLTELKYDVKTKVLQASIKLFTNDLEEALKKIYKKPVDLINGKDKEEINKILIEYLKKHFLLKAANKIQLFNYVGFEIEAEAVWIYIEYKNCPLPKKLEVENTLLFDFIPAQTNIINCELNTVKKNYKVTNPEKLINFNFDEK